MKPSDILYHQINKKQVKPSYECKTENGFEESDIFTIDKVIGNFEQLIIVNQYNQRYTINPNQLTQ